MVLQHNGPLPIQDHRLTIKKIGCYIYLCTVSDCGCTIRAGSERDLKVKFFSKEALPYGNVNHYKVL